MATSELAGKPAPPSLLVDIPRLITMYYAEHPDVSVPEQRVSFGTSGHRGSSLDRSFNEPHILAITQAICQYRRDQGTTGPLYLGMDTHALSRPAWVSALEVLAANKVQVMISADDYTPTPVISHAILSYNRGRTDGLADGIVVTPSHNPPQDGGFKYNPPLGGPADTDTTNWIQNRANDLLAGGLEGVKRVPLAEALAAAATRRFDYIDQYVGDLPRVIDLDVIKESGISMGVDPLGGASLAYWQAIKERYGLNLTVVNPEVDPTFRFMTVDWDGKIRMDPSSSDAMQSLIEMRDQFDIAFACDPDSDRHGIVTRSTGLMPPNHYLTVAIQYLFSQREGWPKHAGVGKTVVSSSMIDRVTASLGRRLDEVPVGFKWFVNGLLDGSLGFGGEESAGASFLARDGSAWSTDKDGIIPALLSAEITARTGSDPGVIYGQLTQKFGNPIYDRVEAPADSAQKDVLKALGPDQIEASTLAGDPITSILTTAPGNGKPIGGVKVSTGAGWFAARPSGTEDIYKIYAESFRGPDHLEQIEREAREIVGRALGAGTSA